MKSYSQYGEDRHIAQAVVTSKTRRLLDLGAWHPTEFSNSRALLESGWEGLLVECSPGPARDLIREYSTWPNVQVIMAAVGFESHCIQMHATDDAVTTSDAACRQKWDKAGGYYGKFWAPQITLEQISNQFSGGFDFINVDVEGCSVDIFRRILDLGWGPLCVCVEHDDRIVEANQAAAKHRYRQIHLNGTNVIFAR
jgi:FkbM family methyltransferase